MHATVLADLAFAWFLLAGLFILLTNQSSLLCCCKQPIKCDAISGVSRSLRFLGVALGTKMIQSLEKILETLRFITVLKTFYPQVSASQ